jgi:DNA-binding response OmpR family regulator
MILIVEDNSGDVLLIREALREAAVDADVQILRDGDKALRYFDEIDSNYELACPALIIIDINLPKRNGEEVLESLRKSRRCPAAMALVVSSSNSPRDRAAMARLGVNGYFCKPSDYEAFMKVGPVVKELLARATEGS